MKNKVTLGFLGFGQMGSAIAAGLAGHCSEVADGTLSLCAYAPHQDKLHEAIGSLPVTPCVTAEEMVRRSDWVLLAVKPYQVESAAAAVRPLLAGKPVVSVVNAMGHDALRKILGDSVRVRYVMPNTPMRVGAGVALFAEENSLTEEENARLYGWFSSISEVVTLPEGKMTTAASLSGCGPAFFFMAVEALGDAGVKNGLSRTDAYHLAAATMAGAGRLLLSTGAHPGELKDGVCSPGGTTIRGVASLEEDGFRSALIHAVDATLGKRS